MNIRLAALGVLLVVLSSACKEEENNYDYYFGQEIRYFDLYMDANYRDFNPLESGLYFIEEKAGTGAMADSGDYVLVNYLAYTIPSENVVDTYTEEWAQEHNLYASKSSQIMWGPYKYEHGSEIAGMREGISMMKEGGIARLIFKSDLGYGSSGLSPIDAFESLMYDIELVKVIGDPQVDEDAKISAYLDTVASYEEIYDEDTETTMYFIPGNAGEGDAYEEKDEVKVYYTGSLLDGREFDSNAGSTTSFKFEVGEGEVITGWDLGIREFKPGATGRLLIPHQLAYGEDGSKVSGTTKTSIPPFEALLFEMAIDTVGDYLND